MTKRITLDHCGLHFVAQVTDEGDVNLLHLSTLPFCEDSVKSDNMFTSRSDMRMVEVQESGQNWNDHHAAKHTGTNPGYRLTYVSHSIVDNDQGPKIEIVQRDDNLTVVSHYQFYAGLSVVRSWTELINQGGRDRKIESVSSFHLNGLNKEGLTPWEDQFLIRIPHNTWDYECQWEEFTLPELGLHPNYSTLNRVHLTSNGTWPTAEHLPMGYLENLECGTAMLWQIENNGSWNWELSAAGGKVYLQLSGPNDQENGWFKCLKAGERFTTVYSAVAFVDGGFDEAVAQMTQYRRAIRRKNWDNEKLGVIFNDYMNCLMGDPTTEKLLPLIDAAAEAGCEYFCIDCGWYSDGPWWDGVGEWLPATKRFPGGLKEPLDYIRKKGMIPGLWLEIEVMGVECPLAKKVPKDWFFQRHGEPVIDHGRYQLDFRNPEVVAHANRVIDRLVNEYGAGYIKMDYNINGGVGTERDADSFGDGLLSHNRAYLAWLDGVFAKYPDLAIENCGSGGMRMEYALLSRHSIQSLSDQTDYLKIAAIAAASPSAVTPEQAAVWSYPLVQGDVEETVFNMVSAIPFRIHQSGHLANISPERFAAVKEGIAYYKAIRHHIPQATAIWPIGVPHMGDDWMALGLKAEDKIYLALWRVNSTESTLIIPLPELAGRQVEVKCAYPSFSTNPYRLHGASGNFAVTFPENKTARIFEFTLKDEVDA